MVVYKCAIGQLRCTKVEKECGLVLPAYASGVSKQNVYSLVSSTSTNALKACHYIVLCVFVAIGLSLFCFFVVLVVNKLYFTLSTLLLLCWGYSL